MSRKVTTTMRMMGMRRLVMVLGLVLAIPAMALMTGAAAAAGPLDGLTVPQADPALVFIEPTPDQPNYAARAEAFVQATVPDTWNGQPVQFLATLNDTGVDVLGMPTSEPAADPHNPQFVYQRFQNGVLFYNGTEGSTSVLPLA